MIRVLAFVVPVLLSVAPAFPAEVAPFPPPLGAPRGVSEGTLGPAVGFQGHPHIASNGEVAIAMWGDSKGEWWGTRVSPIDADGNVLDPIGTLINDGGYPEKIYWNGTEFVAMTIDGTKRTRVRLTPEGQVIDAVVLGMPVGFNLAAVSDDGQRLLFVEWTGTRAAIADRHGEMARPPITLAHPPGGRDVRSFLAAERNGEFLVARFVRKPDTWSSFDLIADRIDSAGRVVSSVAMNLPVDFDENYVMAGGNDGYLFVTQNWMKPAVIAYRLDAAGVFTGTAITLVPDDSDLRHVGYRPAVVRDGSRFLVAWHMSFNHGESEVRVASIPDGAASVSETQRIALWPGISVAVALAAEASQIVALASVNVLYTITGPDLFSIRVSSALTGETPRIVGASRTKQSRIETAAGDNGFGIVWTEDGPDSFTRLFFRRFSATGAPQGEPVEVDRFAAQAHSLPYVQPAIVSNGPVYLLLWRGPNGPRGRRIEASGGWIDPESFPIPVSFVPAGVVAGTHEAAIGAGSGLLRIRFSGEPIAGMTKGTGLHAYSTAVATNGDGYLVVWSEGERTCYFECYYDPFQLLAARFSADGTLLDPSPIVIEDRAGYPDLPSVAWAGDRYLVAWSGWGNVRGATLSRDGVILEANPASTEGIALDDREPVGNAIPRVVAQGDSFVIVTSAKYQFSTPARVGSLDGVRFRYDTPLRSVAALPRRLIAERTYEEGPAVTAAPDGRLLVGWTGEAEPDRAPRVFFQIFGDEERRRPVRR